MEEKESGNGRSSDDDDDDEVSWLNHSRGDVVMKNIAISICYAIQAMSNNKC